MVEVRLFGTFSVAVDGQEIPFRSDTMRALLVWLLLEGKRPIRRDYLAALLYAERTETDGRNNLRVVLHRLKKTFDSHIPHFLETTRKTVQVTEAAWPHVSVDVQAFEQLSTANTPSTRKKALDLYSGDLLAGFNLPNADHFNEQMLARRERLHRQFLATGETHLQALQQTHELSELIHYAEQLLQVEPWHEGAHRGLMWAFAQRGDRQGALRQFATCKAALDEVLGIEPSAETVALYHEIENERFVKVDSAEIPPSLPLIQDQFFGRQRELEQITALFAKPTVRLITLVGMGGIGKTRLSLEAAQRLQDDFAHGAAFVSLAEINPTQQTVTDAVVAAITAALPIQLAGADSVKTQLLNWLKPRKLLLIIDNWEHILSAVHLVDDILREAPQVKIICTSRLALQLRSETTLLLDGVPVADGTAISLFIERAQRIRPDFSPSGSDSALIEQICHFLGGIPLAVELAASGVRRRSLAQLVAQLEKSLGVLRSTKRDLPARQRSLLAVLSDSWDRFDEEIRPIITQLAIFHGGFSEEAMANIVADAPEVLDELIDNFWLHLTEAGQYRFHPVIRQFLQTRVSELLTEPQLNVLKAKHSSYYLNFVQMITPELVGGEPHLAVTSVRQRLENIIVAWRYAIQQKDVVSLLGAVEGVALWHLFAGAFEAGRQQLQAALSLAGDHHEFQSLLLSNQARLQLHSRAAIGEAEAAVEFAQTKRSRALAFRVLAEASRRQQDIAGLEKCLARGVPLAEALNDKRLMGLFYLTSGRLATTQERMADAHTFYAKATDCFRSCNDRRSQALVLRAQGVLAYETGDVFAELALYQQAYQEHLHLEDRVNSAAVLGNIGIWYSERGQTTEALSCFKKALVIFEQVGLPNDLFWMRFELAKAELDLGDFVSAENSFRQLHDQPDLLTNLTARCDVYDGLAMVARATGRFQQAFNYQKQSLAMLNDDPSLVDNLNYAYLEFARICNDKGDWQQARDITFQALEQFERTNLMKADLMHELAQSYLGVGAFAEARQTFAQAAAIHKNMGAPAFLAADQLGEIASGGEDVPVEPILQILNETPRLESHPRPFWCYLVVVEYLLANDDPRAEVVLKQAQVIWQRQLDKLTDPKMRQSFSENIWWNKRLASHLDQHLSVTKGSAKRST